MFIKVSNIKEITNKKELVKLFRQFGEVKNAILFKKQAFVFMPFKEEGRKAIEGLNDTEFKGCNLQVTKTGINRTETVCHTPLGFFRLS